MKKKYTIKNKKEYDSNAMRINYIKTEVTFNSNITKTHIMVTLIPRLT